MQKQIIYPQFIPRLFASNIDIFFLSILTTLIMNPIATIVYTHVFSDYVFQLHQQSKISFSIDMLFSLAFYEYIKDTNRFYDCMICTISLTCIHIALIGVYIIGFWQYMSATPGKILMGMKIVDADSLKKPTKKQFIKRFLGYTTIMIGIWSIIFTQKKQATHDKIASTIVIKT